MSAHALSAIEAALAELGVSAVTVEPVNSPIRNAVYKVTGPKATRALIVPVSNPRIIEYRGRGLELAAVTGLPVPTSISIATTVAVGPVAIVPWLKGGPGPARLRRLREGRPPELVRLGEILATLTAAKPATTEPSTTPPSWVDEVEDAVKRCRVAGPASELIAAAWSQISDTDLDCFAGRARVVHGDLNLSNILFSRDGEIAAVVDWEDARLGDPLIDWAPLLLDEPRVLRWVAEGYGLDAARALFEPADNRRRVAAYALGRCLLQLAYLGDIDRSPRATALAHQARHALAALLSPGECEVRIARALVAELPHPPPDRSIDPVARNAGTPLPVEQWRRRMSAPENRAVVGTTPDIDVLALLGGASFFERHWDREPTVLEAPWLEERNWIEVSCEIGPRLAGLGRAILQDADGKRALSADDFAALDKLVSHQLTVLQDVHLFLPSVARLRAALSAYLGCPITTGLYLNGAEAPGFREHHDAHHVFALQLVGTKRWSIGPPLVIHPSRRYNFVDRSEVGSLTPLDVVAGSLLYMPIGWRHRAEPRGELSVHMTFGVHVPRVIDVVEQLLTQAGASDARLRAPVHFDHGAGGLRWRFEPASVDLKSLALGASGMETPVELSGGARVQARERFAPIEGSWPVAEGAFTATELAGAWTGVAELGEELGEIAGVESVHLRGSALDEDVRDRVMDLDIVVVTNQGGSETRAAASALASRDLGPPIDLRFVAGEELRADTAPPFLRLCLAVRSQQLAGSPIWRERPKIPANAEFARRLLGETLALWRHHVPLICGTRDFSINNVRWLQKRALRVLGFLGLERLGVFTRHPLGCVELCDRLHPSHRALAETIADELFAGAIGAAHAVRAIELGAVLLGRN